MRYEDIEMGPLIPLKEKEQGPRWERLELSPPQKSERDTHFAGFARLVWEEMLSQTQWQGIDVTAGHIPLHHPEDEEHQMYIQIITRRAYDLVTQSIAEYDDADLEWVKRHMDRVFDLTHWPDSSHE